MNRSILSRLQCQFHSVVNVLTSNELHFCVRANGECGNCLRIPHFGQLEMQLSEVLAGGGEREWSAEARTRERTRQREMAREGEKEQEREK